MDLDFMPSPIEDRPGLLVRDGFHYSDATLIIPPVLTACLEFFDGEHSVADAKAELFRLTGEIGSGDLITHLHDALSQAGFLEDAVFEQLRDQAHQEFADAPVRKPAHAGTGYPSEAGELKTVFDEYMQQEAGNNPYTPGKLLGIAAPHVSPFGGWESYQAGYRALVPADRDKTFVVLGVSHQGAPDHFGLTRKPYETPYGCAVTDRALVDRLAAEGGSAVLMEVYCHSFDHSIEFLVSFLQNVY